MISDSTARWVVREHEKARSRTEGIAAVIRISNVLNLKLDPDKRTNVNINLHEAHITTQEDSSERI